MQREVYRKFIVYREVYREVLIVYRDILIVYRDALKVYREALKGCAEYWLTKHEGLVSKEKAAGDEVKWDTRVQCQSWLLTF